MDRSIYTIIYLMLLGENSTKFLLTNEDGSKLHCKSVYRLTDCHAMTMVVYWDNKRNIIRTNRVRNMLKTSKR